MIGSEAATKELIIDKSSWKKVQLGDVVKEVRETVKDPAAEGIDRIVGLEHLESENLHLTSWAELSEGTTFTKVFRKGQMLFGRRRAYLKKAALATFDGICSGDITVLEARKDLIPELLPFLIQNDTFFDLAVKNSAGSLSPRAKFKDFADYEFLLPPKDQQAQLAELLWAADAVVKKSSMLEKSLLTFRDTFIHKFFVSQRDKYEKLEKLSEIKYGLTMNSKRKKMPISAPYLRVANVSRGEISLSEVKETGCTEDEINTYQLEENDILIVEGHADSREIGRAAMWVNESEVMLHQNHLIRVRCNKEHVLPEVIETYINSTFGQSYFSTNSKSTSGLNTINSSIVKSCKIPIIKKGLQDIFVKKKISIDSQIKTVRKQIENSQSLQKSLINQIF